jgi:hypothetical protein
MHVIPESADTCGHATVGNATLWIEALKELFDICVPARSAVPNHHIRDSGRIHVRETH